MSSPAAPSSTHLRSLYRSLLRELPPRPPTTTTRSPLHQRIRTTFAPSSSTPDATSPKPSTSPLRQAQEAEQFIKYARSQRVYTTLLERYNPGMNMDDEERVRLSARRVGMEMPVEFKVRPWGSHGGDGNSGEGSGAGEGEGQK